MEDNKEGEEQNSKEFKETEIVQALQTELAKVISECAGPEAAWRQLPKESAPREVGVRSGAGCRAFEERPYNEEEDVTEDEGAAVIKLPPKKRNVPRGPKPKATVVTAEPEPEEEEEEEEQGLLPEPAKPSRFMDQHKTMLPLVAQKLSEVSAPHKLYSKVLPGFSRPPFLIVIPTYGRPDRLVRETLAFLRRQKIPQNLIEIWLAPGHAPGQKFSERERYEKALAPEWPDVHIRTGVKGVMQQRWRIGLAHPEGMHLVSFDDDIPEVFEKIKPGTSSDTMQPLEAGSLEAIIHHARDLMHQEGCYIWGLAPSANPMNLVVNRISRRNGMVNGFAYGYLNRHDECFQSLYCSPTEDVERSCRFYEKDGVLLRYLMYAARTKFKAPDGISLLYENARARKLDEEAAIVKISDEFPHLLQVRTGERRRKSEEAMNFTFISIGQGPLLPNGVTTKAWAAGISGQPPIDTGATETKETQVLSEVKVQDPKLKAKLTKQAQDEKELLDKCVQIQEYLLEQQEAAEDALHTGKAPKEQTQSVQKLLENVINGANVDKVIFSKRKAPKPVPPQVEAPRAQVTSQDNGVEVGKLEVMRPPIPALPLATTAALRQDEGVQGAVTPQHLLLATSLAKVQALQQFQSHNWNWGNDFSRDEWWMTRAPVTPPELRQSQVLSVDLSDNEVISASPGHTPPLQGPTEPANKRGLLRPPESDDEDVEIVAVNGETPGGTIFPRLVPPEAPAAPRLVPPEVQGESKEPSLHPEPATEFSDLEDDDFIRRLQDTVTT